MFNTHDVVNELGSICEPPRLLDEVASVRGGGVDMIEEGIMDVTG